jgi:hypothetical protein
MNGAGIAGAVGSGRNLTVHGEKDRCFRVGEFYLELDIVVVVAFGV